MAQNRTRSKQIIVRTTDEEYNMIFAQALKANMNMTEFLITSASKKAIKVEVKPHGEEILKELRAIGNNVNQIARAVNSNPNLETKKLANNLIAINDLLVKLKKEWSTNGNSKGNKGNGEEPRENN